jgi:septal ring factor EnvC (AmiA/AmiB activator)
MNRSIRRAWKLAAFAVALAGALPLLTDGRSAIAAETSESQQAKAKLAAVRARIADLTNRRGRELAQRDASSARLREAELEITAKRQSSEALQTAAGAAEQRRTQLRADQQRTEGALAAERASLAAQVRSAAMMGRQQEIKLLLNQTDAHRLGRMLAYEGYFGRARAAQIGQIQAQLLRLSVLHDEIEAQSARLKARAARAALIRALAGQVQSADQELAALQREEQGVESLLADLARLIQDFPTDTQQSFDALRGKLPWPVGGRLAARYHDLRADAPQGGLRWNGVLIAAAKGAKVRAPYFGRVIYADWLQGLGLLMIISHTGGYLSLYGHAEVLYKSVGDWVAPGDIIAALPDSGAETAQLYFEIRQGRKPVDPKLWLK